MASEVEKVIPLLKEEFGSLHNVSFKSHSPNAQHYEIVSKLDSRKQHLKVVKNSYLLHNEYSELDILKSIDHEHIVSLNSSGMVGRDRTYLVFPHIDGFTLDYAEKRVKGFWTQERLLQLASSIGSALVYLSEKGIVHRDIKPKNIIYDARSDKFMLLDLGIGYFMQNPGRDSSVIQKNATGAGSRLYSAPEQFFITNNEPYDITPRIDQFSLGSIIYEYATGYHPFIKDGDTKAQNYNDLVTKGEILYGDISTSPLKEYAATLKRMLQKYPSDRFQRATDFYNAFLGTRETSQSISRPPLYFKMPHTMKDDLIDFCKDNREKVDGVFLTANDSPQVAESVSDAGIAIILDPETYKATQDKGLSQKLAKSLGLKSDFQHKFSEIALEIDNLLLGVYELSSQRHSTDVMLPYFCIDAPNSPAVTYTKEIWKKARSFYDSRYLSYNKVYAAVVIPHQVIENDEIRSQLLSQLAGSYDVDGIILSFTSGAGGDIATRTDSAYISGIKKITDFFESNFDNVIVYRSGIESLAINQTAGWVTAWAKSMRNFKLTKGFGNGKPDYKMKYFVGKFFTFIEEQRMIRAISTHYPDYMACTCKYCEISQPLLLSYIPEENEKYERLHYFAQIADLHSLLYEDGKKTTNTVRILKESDIASELVKANRALAAVTNKTIPSYKRLIAIIED